MRISDWTSDVCSSDLDQLVTCQDSFSAPPELGTRYAWASAQWGRGRAVNLFESRKFCRVQPIDATSRGEGLFLVALASRGLRTRRWGGAPSPGSMLTTTSRNSIISISTQASPFQPCRPHIYVSGRRDTQGANYTRERASGRE